LFGTIFIPVGLRVVNYQGNTRGIPFASYIGHCNIDEQCVIIDKEKSFTIIS
jgi:hypothetical protein